MELEVIEGARSLIQRCSPFIYAENNCVRHSKALIETLYGLPSYSVFWHVVSRDAVLVTSSKRTHTASTRLSLHRRAAPRPGALL